jgi:hypothetical protein
MKTSNKCLEKLKLLELIKSTMVLWWRIIANHCYLPILWKDLQLNQRMEIFLGLICTCQVKIIVNICTMLNTLFGSLFWWKWWDNMAIISFHFSINPWKNVFSFYQYLKRINDMQQYFWMIHLTTNQIFNLQFAYFNFKWESCMGCILLAQIHNAKVKGISLMFLLSHFHSIVFSPMTY